MPCEIVIMWLKVSIQLGPTSPRLAFSNKQNKRYNTCVIERRKETRASEKSCRRPRDAKRLADGILGVLGASRQPCSFFEKREDDDGEEDEEDEAAEADEAKEAADEEEELSERDCAPARYQSTRDSSSL